MKGASKVPTTGNRFVPHSFPKKRIQPSAPCPTRQHQTPFHCHPDSLRRVGPQAVPHPVIPRSGLSAFGGLGTTRTRNVN